MGKKKKLWWRRLLLWNGLLFFTMGLVFMETDSVQAGVYDNAYEFYRNYGNEMRFLPGQKNEGEIYYATKGKKNVNSGIRYTTIGWKVRIFQSTGACVETIYYKLDGDYMTAIDIRTADGYEYCLYRVTLEDLKTRLSQAGLQTLQSPDCNIIFDACISIKRNGRVEGGMTDAGPSWGTVYTTYNGISHAENWAADTKESLKSYYGKTVEDLFYEVKVEKENGIHTVSGEGRYCFGSNVSLEAKCEAGYHFEGWTGSAVSEKEVYSFVIYGEDMEFVANAKENAYRFQFDYADGSGSVVEQEFLYQDTVKMPNSGGGLEGATLSGWRIPAGKNDVVFSVGENVWVKNIVHSLGLERTDGATILVYALWDEGPRIKTEEIYVSLADAVSGRITEEWLALKAEAYDLEDGEIPYGKNENTSFFMENYQAEDFTELQEEGCITKLFWAIDSAGNIAKKDVLVHITDTEIYPKENVYGRVRFINEKYFWDTEGNLLSETQGGLAEDSIWRKLEDYRKLLEILFKEKRR